MFAFPDSMPHRFPSEDAARSCVLHALRSAHAYATSSEGASAIAALETDSPSEELDQAIEQMEQAAWLASAESGADVKVEFDDGSQGSLFVPNFMDAVLLGTAQAQEMVSIQSSAAEEVDVRIIAGALAYENQTSFEDALLWLHSLALAGLLSIEGDGNRR